MIEDYRGRHRLGDRHGPNADAGIVSPLRDDLGFLT
jgi:hypothetical protein